MTKRKTTKQLIEELTVRVKALESERGIAEGKLPPEYGIVADGAYGCKFTYRGLKDSFAYSTRAAAVKAAWDHFEDFGGKR